jgi:hypothetical protein
VGQSGTGARSGTTISSELCFFLALTCNIWCGELQFIQSSELCAQSIAGKRLALCAGEGPRVLRSISMYLDAIGVHMQHWLGDRNTCCPNPKTSSNSKPIVATGRLEHL